MLICMCSQLFFLLICLYYKPFHSSIPFKGFISTIFNRHTLKKELLRPAEKIPCNLTEKSSDFSAALETEVECDTDSDEEIETNSLNK